MFNCYTKSLNVWIYVMLLCVPQNQIQLISGILAPLYCCSEKKNTYISRVFWVDFTKRANFLGTHPAGSGCSLHFHLAAVQLGNIQQNESHLLFRSFQPNGWGWSITKCGVCHFALVLQKKLNWADIHLENRHH